MKKLFQKGFTLLETTLLALVVVFAVGAGYYVWNSNNKTENTATSNVEHSEQKDKEETKTSFGEEGTYSSLLYPDMSFTVPAGWEVYEKDEYTPNELQGEGSADGEIVVWGGDKTNVVLSLITVRPTGFEGYSCYNHPEVVKVGDVYRIKNSKGEIIYSNGITSMDDDWVNAKNTEFSDYEEGFSNFCVQFPFLRTYTSTLNQSDYPDELYGFSGDNNRVYVFLEANVNGPLEGSLLNDADTIIRSLSKSTDIN